MFRGGPPPRREADAGAAEGGPGSGLVPSASLSDVAREAALAHAAALAAFSPEAAGLRASEAAASAMHYHLSVDEALAALAESIAVTTPLATVPFASAQGMRELVIFSAPYGAMVSSGVEGAEVFPLSLLARGTRARGVGWLRSKGIKTLKDRLEVSLAPFSVNISSRRGEVIVTMKW